MSETIQTEDGAGLVTLGAGAGGGVLLEVHRASGGWTAAVLLPVEAVRLALALARRAGVVLCAACGGAGTCALVRYPGRVPTGERVPCRACGGAGVSRNAPPAASPSEPAPGEGEPPSSR